MQREPRKTGQHHHQNVAAGRVIERNARERPAVDRVVSDLNLFRQNQVKRRIERPRRQNARQRHRKPAQPHQQQDQNHPDLRRCISRRCDPAR